MFFKYFLLSNQMIGFIVFHMSFIHILSKYSFEKLIFNFNKKKNLQAGELNSGHLRDRQVY